jgi:hypothetical protein
MQIMKKQAAKKRQLSQQLLVSQLTGMIVFERRDMRPVGIIKHIIFRPENLQVAFFGCQLSDGICYIRADHTAPLAGFLTVQGSECFGECDDFIREKRTFEQDCRLLGYKALDENEKKLGVVENCSIKLSTMTVDRIYVRRPLPQNIMQSSLVISTSAVIEVQPKEKTVIIRSNGKVVRKAAIKPVAA